MSQSKLKKYSQIISVISQILWIILIIATIFIAILGTIASFLFSRLEIDNYNNISLYDITINTDKIITYLPPELKSSTESVINYFKAFISEHTKAQKFLMIETFVIIAVAELIIMIMLIYNIYILFKNIHEKETPFIKDNSRKLRYISLLLLIIISIDCLGTNFIYALYSLNFKTTFNLSSLYIIFIIYTFSYLFEYGHSLELKINKMKEGSQNEK